MQIANKHVLDINNQWEKSVQEEKKKLKQFKSGKSVINKVAKKSETKNR